MPGGYPGPVGIQFFGQDLGQAGMDTLTDLRLPDDHDDLAIGGYLDECVWFEGGLCIVAE
ncbi:hypothetical protein D3C76_1689890 [compost metagenome]